MRRQRGEHAGVDLDVRRAGGELDASLEPQVRQRVLRPHFRVERSLRSQSMAAFDLAYRRKRAIGRSERFGFGLRSAAAGALAGVEHLAARGLVHKADDPAGGRIQTHAEVLVLQRQLGFVNLQIGLGRCRGCFAKST